MTDELIQKLNGLAKENIKEYTHKTTPDFPEEKIIGVRVPDIRAVAKEIVKSDWQSFLDSEHGDTIEETMLRGFVTATAPMADEERFERIKKFVPEIDNWMVCDTFCNTLKPKKQNKDAYWGFIQPYFYSENEYDVRFAIVMMLSHFGREEYADRAFEILNSVNMNVYYVKMAAAWAISVYFVYCPEKTMAFLKDNNLDDFTFNKALQKITESYRVDSETKKIIRTMKRKNSNG